MVDMIDFTDASYADIEDARTLVDTAKYHELARGKVLEGLNRLDETNSTYAQLANAERGLPEPSKEMREIYRQAAENAGANRDRYLALLRRWENGTLPAVMHTRRIPSGHATYRGANRTLALPEQLANTRMAKTVIRAIPHLGDAPTVGDEIRRAATGEQSWRVTGIRSVGLVAAGNIGSFVGGGVGALAGTAAGAAVGAVTGAVPMIGTIPGGAVIGAAAGSVIGDAALTGLTDFALEEILGEHLADEIDPAYAQPRVESAPHI